MIFQRRQYLNRIIAHKHNKLIKIITGIRRCGKSFLLFTLFKQHLLDSGVKASHIIEIPLDDREYKELRDPDKCLKYVKRKIKDDKMYYLLLDEVQYMAEFEDVLNSFLHVSNLDVYVTGSNSRLLSKDIITEFRGRGDEIHIRPLSFSEYYEAFSTLDWEQAWKEYYTYGGLPFAALLPNAEEKEAYLKRLFEEVYLKDIIERNHTQANEQMEILLNIISSNIGSLTNPKKLEDTFKSVSKVKLSAATIHQYLNHFIDAFIIDRAERYDIKGNRYISTPQKYYFSDLGLRNARINFRQQEETHIMENIIYNELCGRGFSVDVGVVEILEKAEENKYVRKHIEIDFVANKGSRRYYVQSAFALPDAEKRQQEERPLRHVPDSFKKIIVVKDNIMLWRNDAGVVTMGLQQFLLDENSLNL